MASHEFVRNLLYLVMIHTEDIHMQICKTLCDGFENTFALDESLTFDGRG